MYVKNQLLFPTEVIPVIQEARGIEWAQLVQDVKDLPEDHPDKLALCLMMICCNGCLECETDSYRAMRGCDLCSLQTLRRFKGLDCDLLGMYRAAARDVGLYLRSLQSQAA